jgi:ETC complex I subunit conserved region
LHEIAMAAARIYQPAKTAMQSGAARTKEWVLEFDSEAGAEIDPLMGWTSGRDTQKQVQLAFATRAEAEAYAQRNGIAYRVMEPSKRHAVKKAYADNFKFGRIGRWTH